MARIKIEIEDLDDGETSFLIDGNDLATTATIKENSLTQNLAIILIEELRKNGVGGKWLPDLREKKA